MPATVEVADGRLRIAAGDTAIGDWNLEDVHLEQIPTGYRMAAEGEQILVELGDIDGFEEALAANARKRRFRRKGWKPDKIESAEAPRRKAPEPPPLDPPSRLEAPDPAPTEQATPAAPKTTRRSRKREEKQDRDEAKARQKAEKAEAKARPRRAKTRKAERREESPQRAAAIDRVVSAAERRWGALLPEWVFTRGVLVTVVLVLAILIVFRSVASPLLLILGGLLIAFGGIAYSDEIVASKWLPGRMTPVHPLLGGTALVLVGILLGLVA